MCKKVRKIILGHEPTLLLKNTQKTDRPYFPEMLAETRDFFMPELYQNNVRKLTRHITMQKDRHGLFGHNFNTTRHYGRFP